MTLSDNKQNLASNESKEKIVKPEKSKQLDIFKQINTLSKFFRLYRMLKSARNLNSKEG